MTHKVKPTRTWLNSQLVMVFERLKLTTILPGALDIQSVTEENGVVTIKTYEDFTVHYTDSHPDSQNRKYKTYTLKKVGSSYVITDIVVTKGS